MPKTVILNNTSFVIPEPGDIQYGEDLSLYLQEIATVLSSVHGTFDILETNFSFNNTQSSPANINGLLFSTTDVISFDISYIITRDNGTNKITEVGTLKGFQGDTGWEIARGASFNDVNNTNFPSSNGDIGVTFSITSGGQVQYTSNTYPSQTSGIITFKASTSDQ